MQPWESRLFLNYDLMWTTERLNIALLSCVWVRGLKLTILWNIYFPFKPFLVIHTCKDKINNHYKTRKKAITKSGHWHKRSLIINDKYFTFTFDTQGLQTNQMMKMMLINYGPTGTNNLSKVQLTWTNHKRYELSKRTKFFIAFPVKRLN